MPQVSKKPFTVKAELLELYTEAGFTLFPCSGFTKIPKMEGFQDLHFDPYYRPVDCNHGALLRDQYLVIDVDKRHFKGDDRPFSRLFESLEIPLAQAKDTFTVKTPSGGFHFYYRKPQAVKLRATHKDFPGLEFKTKFIMAAGSYNGEAGQHYTILHKNPSSIAPAPDLLLALLSRPPEVDMNAEGAFDNHPINVSRFIDFCTKTDPAVAGHNGDNKTFQVACFGKDLGLTWERCLELMVLHFNPRCQPPWSEDSLENKVKNAYEYGQKPAGIASIDQEFDKVEDGKPKKKIYWNQTKDGKKFPTLGNTIIWLTQFPDSPLRDKLRYNSFSNRIEFITPPLWLKQNNEWCDEDAIQIKNHLSAMKFFEVSTNTIHEAALVIASEKTYHPVQDYLRTVQWDGVPRLNTWLTDYCNAPKNEYTSFIGRKTLLGAVARVMKPGCKFDYVLVLEGEQGVGKSMMCRILAEPWFTDASIDVRSKDSVDILQGHWIIELSEMDILSKSESKTLKGFISRQEDRCRPAYGRVTKTFPRQCIFIGTINPESEGYLKDPTGNRRFWPVHVDHVNLTKLRQDRDQLWAEAYLAYIKGETLHVDSGRMDHIMRQEILTREQEDPWVPLIDNWIDAHAFDYYNHEAKRCEFQVIDVYVNCVGGNPTTFGGREALRIATALKKLGFARLSVQRGDASKTVYVKSLDRLI